METIQVAVGTFFMTTNPAPRNEDFFHFKNEHTYKYIFFL